MSATDPFDGLAIQDSVPLTWRATENFDAARLEHANDETTRALHALAVIEDPPRDPHQEETSTLSAEGIRIEAKLDLLLTLVGRLASRDAGLPECRAVVLRASSIEWLVSKAADPASGRTGFVDIYLNPMVPLPFRFAAEISAVVTRDDGQWALASLLGLNAGTRYALEKFIFRRHRRLIASARKD